MKYNLLIVEDHELTRFGLKTTFENVDFIDKIFEAQDAQEAFDLVKLHKKIDITIMDLGLPNIDGISAMKIIKQLNQKMKFVVLTSHNDSEEVLAALKVGTNSYCSKDIKPKKLVEVVQSTLEGASWFDPKVSNIVLDVVMSDSQNNLQKKPEQNYNLTIREKQVLQLMAEGLTNQEIAKKLYVSINTTKAHVCSILQKLSVEDRTQAVIKTLKEKII